MVYKKEVPSGVYKTPKTDNGFDNTMVLKTRMFVASKYPTAFENHSILQNRSIYLILQKYFVSKVPNKA
jgi:hypothetical protein